MAKPAAVLATLALCLACLAVLGQSTPPPPAAPPAAETPRGQQTRREVARLYILQRMRESLSLSDAQTLKVMDVLADIDEERQANQAIMRDAVVDLQGQLADASTPEEKLRASVAEFQKRQAKHEAALRDLDNRLLAALTPRQQAQFLVLRRQIMEEIREEMPPRTRANRPRKAP